MEANFTDIRNKMLHKMGYALKDVNVNISEEEINRRVLAPLCALDIAYGMWQDMKNVPFKHETKRIANSINNMWFGSRKSLYGMNGVLFDGLTEEEIALLSNYSDSIATNMEKGNKYMYYYFQNNVMDLPVKERDICTKLCLIGIICLMVDCSIQIDIHTMIVSLNKIGHCFIKMAGYYRKEVLQIKEHDLKFFDKNEQLNNCLKVMYGELKSTPIQ